MAEATAIKKTTETRRVEEVTLNQKIYEFIQKNRKILLISLIALVAILVGLIVAVTVQERTRANAFGQVDALNRRYNELRIHLANGDIIRQAEALILLGDLRDFQSRASGFPAARAYALSGGLYTEMQMWPEAEAAWLNAARAARRNYFAPIALFNAGVAAEEQGNIQAAIGFYAEAIGFGDVFPFAARAQFAIGRLEEERNNWEAALGAYRTLLARWPHDPVWANFAQNRIIMLSE